MFRQAFGRACGTLISTLVLALALAACGGSDEGGDATKSPTLPKPSFSDIKVSCTDVISVGETDQCSATCDITRIDEDGDEIVQQDVPCPGGGTWATDCDDLSVDRAGNITGISPGVCNVTYAIGRARSEDEKVTIVDVTADCSIIYVSGTETDPVPNATCSNNAADRSVEVPVGVQLPLRAAVRLSDGNLCYAPDAPQGGTTCPAGIVTFFTSDTDVARFANPANGIASAVDVGTADLTATASVNAVEITVTELELESTLCVEPRQPAFGCQSYSQATIQCVGAAEIPNVPINGTAQFRARAFFGVSDNDPNTGLVCDVTNNENTTWSIADVGDEASANPSVNDSGRVSGGATATTGATVMASFDLDNNSATTDDVAEGTHDFNVVDSLVLAANSLMVSATRFDQADPVPTRAACVGSYDLVSGLVAPGGVLAAEKGFFAATRKCNSSELDGTECPDDAFDNTTLDDVTNAESGNGQASEADGAITWAIEPGYWDGNECTLATDPAGEGDNMIAALLGDDDAGTRYTDGAAFTGAGGDSRIFAAGSDEDNGQLESVGPIRLQTNCVTATYNATNTNGAAAKSVDGLTLIILPLTNDSLLTDPDASAAVELCNTLVPLFNLGASSDGANGAVIQLVATIAAVANPITTGLGGAGLDDAVDQILAALEGALEGANDAGLDQLTGPLTDVLEAVNEGAFEPLNCALGTLLQAIATQDPSSLPNIQACQP